jgi:phosphoglycerol transferase MdoB-like AlkP superfamily enzyme
MCEKENLFSLVLKSFSLKNTRFIYIENVLLYIFVLERLLWREKKKVREGFVSFLNTHIVWKLPFVVFLFINC